MLRFYLFLDVLYINGNKIAYSENLPHITATPKNENTAKEEHGTYTGGFDVQNIFDILAAVVLIVIICNESRIAEWEHNILRKANSRKRQTKKCL